MVLPWPVASARRKNHTHHPMGDLQKQYHLSSKPIGETERMELCTQPGRVGRRRALDPLMLPLLLLLLLPLLLGPVAHARPNLCFEMLSDREAIYLQQHPGKGMAVVGKQGGKIYLMSLPAVGARKSMNTISTYLDLSDRVMDGDETGLLSFAFHPQFAKNGRFFVSYICNRDSHDDCRANFGCVPPSACGVKSGRATTVIAEYSAGLNPLAAKQLKPREVRRILTYGRPHNNHMGGHIFFGRDSFLYITSGDGGSQNDPNNLAQNLRSYFGKIMRININRWNPRWANYSIPSSNPFTGAGQNKLIYALGLRNPWRCDPNPYWKAIVCGDVGGSDVEEINVVLPRGNYQWSNYEGKKYRKNDRTITIGQSTGPTFSYTHDSLGGPGCVIGGVFITAQHSPCLKGKYVYADHSGPVWVATFGSRRSTNRVTFKCAPNSPMQCPTSSGDGSDAEWGEVYSWSKDRAGNAYLLTSSGIFRVGRQSSCGIRC